MNGFEIAANVGEQERTILAQPAGEMNREAFLSWLGDHLAADNLDPEP